MGVLLLDSLIRQRLLSQGILLVAQIALHHLGVVLARIRNTSVGRLSVTLQQQGFTLQSLVLFGLPQRIIHLPGTLAPAVHITTGSRTHNIPYHKTYIAQCRQSSTALRGLLTARPRLRVHKILIVLLRLLEVIPQHITHIAILATLLSKPRLEIRQLRQLHRRMFYHIRYRWTNTFFHIIKRNILNP